MNKLGQLDQIVTSIIILFASFLLAFLFIIISAGAGSIFGAGSVEAANSVNNENFDSRILGEIFLADKISTGQQELSIKEALTALTSSTELRAEYGAALVNVFESKYSCGGQNSFVFGRIYSQKISKEDYGDFYEDIIRYVKRAEDAGTNSNYIQLASPNTKGFYQISLGQSGEDLMVISVKEAVKC